MASILILLCNGIKTFLIAIQSFWLHRISRLACRGDKFKQSRKECCCYKVSSEQGHIVKAAFWDVHPNKTVLISTTCAYFIFL